MIRRFFRKAKRRIFGQRYQVLVGDEVINTIRVRGDVIEVVFDRDMAEKFNRSNGVLCIRPRSADLKVNYIYDERRMAR